MPQLYKNKIVQAFRDNAIKSVLLIDDEYLPYEGLVNRYVQSSDELKEIFADVAPTDPEAVDKLRDKLKSVREIVSSANTDLMNSETAKEFVNFFHHRQLVCDVENQTDNLDTDKIRKSDLIILDYHLRKDGDNRAEKSLNLISALSTSKHMNMVVVYTAEPLVNVWFEIASSLRGTFLGIESDFFDGEALRSWQQNGSEWLEAWGNVVDRNTDAAYLCNEHDIEDLCSKVTRECEALYYEEPNDVHVQWMLERSVQRFNLTQKVRSDLELHGGRSLWLQAGDVFVVLCSKTKDDDGNNNFRDTTPLEVWELIEGALEAWYPNFYRIVLSELQNQIEDSNFSMSKMLGRPIHEQVTLLWSILKESPDSQLVVSEQLLKSVLEDISEDLLNRNEKAAPNFIKDLAISSLHEALEFVPYTRQTKVDHKQFIKQAVLKAKQNSKDCDENFDDEYCESIAHAFNERTTTRRELPSYITTGTILKSEKGGKTSWYMCVSPSCDTVPGQRNLDNAAQLHPHRLLTFAKLDVVNLATALAEAHYSSYVFVSDCGERIALSVVDTDSKQPNLVKLVVVNHNTEDLSLEGKKVLKLKNNGDGIKSQQLKMLPIVQLESNYAARYQAVQSHFEGRIGVDFLTADFLSDEEVPTE